MDRDAHRRFLEYRDTFPYFHSKDKTPLGREEWLAYDAELLALEAKAPGELSDDEVKRVRALRRVLLRD